MTLEKTQHGANILTAEGWWMGGRAVGQSRGKGQPITYTFKLSRRLARLRCGAILATTLLSVSCAPEGPSDFSSSSTMPDITPEAAAVGVPGTTYFLADAESGMVSPPWVYWGVYGNDAPKPVSSTNRARNGSRSFRFETDSCAGHASCSSFLTTNKPQVSMGCAQGNFCSGWYSAYLYVDAGWTESSWDAVFNFMASLPQIDPIGHVGLNFHDGVLQLYWNMKNCQVGHYVCPNISGYTNRNGDYYMSASSPAGIVPFPRSRWVHVAVYYGMARTNGKIQIWQDGVLIENLTASTLNTLDGNMRFNNSGGDIGSMGVGEYHGALTEPVRRLYADDFRVSSYRPIP
jgi:hypothetical protein